jgi:hypothetical protein
MEVEFSQTDSNSAIVRDIDQEDGEDEFAVSVYAADVYENMMLKERREPYRSEYLDDHTEITENMRGILLDWLVDVNVKFRLSQETLFLTQAVIDRFLSKDTSIRKKHLQLVGISAMLLASKFEEIYPPEIRDCIFYSRNIYTADEIRQMEAHILATLDFNICMVTPTQFMKRFCKASASSPLVHLTATYFLELSLVDLGALSFFPSELAAGSIFLAQQVIGQGAWDATAIHYTKQQVPGCLRAAAYLLELARTAKSERATLHAVFRKYANKKYSQVAKVSLSRFQLNYLGFQPEA